MSPTRLPARAWLTRFPRVSGDEPVTGTFHARASLFSPRERG